MARMRTEGILDFHRSVSRDRIRAFGLRNAYASTGPAQWLAGALIAAGWILATAVIAGVTRTVRRD
jgi:hypothetical protein